MEGRYLLPFHSVDLSLGPGQDPYKQKGVITNKRGSLQTKGGHCSTCPGQDPYGALRVQSRTLMVPLESISARAQSLRAGRSVL